MPPSSRSQRAAPRQCYVPLPGKNSAAEVTTRVDMVPPLDFPEENKAADGKRGKKHKKIE